MKKTLAILLIIFTLLSFVGCDKLFGAANIYVRYDTDADGNEIKVEVMHAPKNKDEIWLERYYNKDGWLEREISYTDGKIGYITVFRSNGSRVSNETFFYEENARAVEAFDENDVRLTNHNYVNEKLDSIEEFYPSGNRSKVTSYSDPNYHFTSYHFDENGTEIAYHAKWTENGNVYEEYDILEGRIRISSDMYVTTVDGEFLEHYLTEYAPNGEMTNTIHYDKDGNVYDISGHH